MNQILNIIIVALLLISTTQALCPAFIRIVNAFTTNVTSIDFNVNGQVLNSGIAFRTVSSYSAIIPGTTTAYITVSGTSTNIAVRSFVAAPNVAYTVALTGPAPAPSGTLLFPNSPFIFYEQLSLPTPGTYRGTFYRLSETNATVNFEIDQSVYSSVAPYVNTKTSVQYASQQPGFATFRMTTLTGATIDNSIGNPEQLSVSVGSEILFDLFLIGDNSNGINPESFSTSENYPSYDQASGCNLLPGVSPYPNPTPTPPVFTFQPCASSSSLTVGLSLILIVIALFF